MANPNTSNVLVGKPLVTGGVLIAPVGTTLPTTTGTTPATAFVGVGYVTDDGLTKSDSIDSSNIYAWGGALIASPQKTRSVTFKFTFAEQFNALEHQIIYGTSAVTATAATTGHGNQLAIAGGTAVPPKQAYIFDMFQGAQLDRIVVPIAQVTDLGDVNYKDDDIASREVTITCFPDTAGNYFYEYTDDGQKTSS